MKTIRKDFTEGQKAAIYARDRATCAFSTESLWLLDHGIKSNCVFDWADHITPCALGGSAELENGICASDVDNIRKRDNISHNQYFVENGALTELYSKKRGTPNQELLDQLDRLKNLHPADWFFNRSIINIFVGYEGRCVKEFKGIEWSRDDKYWFKSAWKRLNEFHKKKPSKSIAERGLLRNPLPFGSSELLKLETIHTLEDLNQLIEANYEAYRQSFKVFFEYFTRVPKSERANYISKVEELPNLHPRVITAIKLHLNSQVGTKLPFEVMVAKAQAER